MKGKERSSGKLINELLSSFPREVSLKRRLIQTKESAEHYIRKTSPYTNIYISLYGYKHWDLLRYQGAVIDSILLDIDYHNSSLEWDELMSSQRKLGDAYRYVVFSGRGFHVFVLLKEPTTQEAMWELQTELLSIPFHSNLGDISRLIRVPRSYNFKAKTFSRYLTLEDIENNELPDEIRKPVLIGSEWLTGVKEREVKDWNVDYSKKDPICYNETCIDNILSMENPGHDLRWGMIQLMSDLLRQGTLRCDLSDEEIDGVIEEIMQRIKKENKWSDFIEYKTRKYVTYVVKKYDNSPRCSWFKSRGVCFVKS